jgi:hypothetical protein
MKKIILISLILLVGCTKPELPVPTPEVTVSDIFNIKESTVSDGQEINFTLKNVGTYTLTLKDSTLNQVITRERFQGKVGINKLNLYTKSIQSKYLYLTLVDNNNNLIGKTIINLKK